MDFAYFYDDEKLPEGCMWIDLRTFKDERGSLSLVEQQQLLPFKLERVFWITNVPQGQTRGGHAHRTCAEIIIPLQGSFDIYVDDARNSVSEHLSSPQRGILIPAGVWCELENFESGSICLVLASQEYDSDGYINDYQTFLKYRHASDPV